MWNSPFVLPEFPAELQLWKIPTWFVRIWTLKPRGGFAWTSGCIFTQKEDWGFCPPSLTLGAHVGRGLFLVSTARWNNYSDHKLNTHMDMRALFQDSGNVDLSFNGCWSEDQRDTRVFCARSTSHKYGEVRILQSFPNQQHDVQVGFTVCSTACEEQQQTDRW